MNPFRGKASFVTRELLANPLQVWTGHGLAKKRGLSQAWVNRILDFFVNQRLVQREAKGHQSQTRLLTTKNILKKWVHAYNIEQNPHYLFYQPTGDPLQTLIAAHKKENFSYALTGYAAANLIKETTHHAPPMIYIWPKNPPETFDGLIRKLENIYGFIPVTKQANIILLKPIQKEAVFFEAFSLKNKELVSAVQLFLDLHGLQRGPAVINELASFWKKHHLDYEL